jgi:predicted protein tyrosine phosphatase
VKVLFVCTGNVDRSKTAEALFKSADGLEVRSAGTSVAAAVRLSRELIEWADKIFVMEYEHQRAVVELNPEAELKVKCLDIPDKYVYGAPELQQLLKERLRPHLNIS